MKALSSLCFILFISCSLSKTQKSHKQNEALPQIKQELWGIGLLTSEVVLGSREKMQQDLSLSATELNDVITLSLNDSILSYFVQASQEQTILLPSLQKSSLDESRSVATDSTRFIRVNWPIQGQIFSLEGDTPKYLFLLHDVYIAMGLSSKGLYDYQEAHKEIGENKSKKFSIVLSYTIWDNELQQYIRYGSIDWRKETYTPITPKLIHTGFKNALAKAWEFHK